MTEGRYVVLVVEDELSEVVMRRLVRDYAGHLVIDRVFRPRGCGQIKVRMPQFRQACLALPHIVLTDLDRYPCAPALLSDWDADGLPDSLLFRVAVKEVEAWLLADRSGIADFLGVPPVKVPANPELEADPKRTLLNLARKSRKKRLAEGLLPPLGSASPIGPLYNISLGEFVAGNWDVGNAIDNAASLARAVTRISSFVSAQ